MYSIIYDCLEEHNIPLNSNVSYAKLFRLYLLLPSVHFALHTCNQVVSSLKLRSLHRNSRVRQSWAARTGTIWALITSFIVHPHYVDFALHSRIPTCTSDQISRCIRNAYKPRIYQLFLKLTSLVPPIIFCNNHYLLSSNNSVTPRLALYVR